MATEIDDALQIGSTLQEIDAEMGDPETRPDEELHWAQRSDDAFAAEVKEKEQQYYEYALQHGYIDMWLAMMSEYYGRDPQTFAGFEASGIDFEGEDAELVRFRINELHSYVRQTTTGVTKERPAFKAGTLNTDYAAACQTEMTDTLVNYIYEAFFGEKRERMLVERGELFATTWGWVRWDEMAGEESQAEAVDPMTGEKYIEVVNSGEPVGRVKMPWDVISDPTIEDEDDHTFWIVRERRTKHELIAAYPDFEEEIRGASLKDETAYELCFAFDDDIATDEDVLIKHVYNRKDGVMPEGQYAVVLDSTVLERVALTEVLKSGDVPLVPYQPEPMVGTSFGYSEAWDLLVLQQMKTQLTSDVATNITMNARSVVVMPKGSEITADQLANGASALYVASMDDKPEGLNLTTLQSGAFTFLDWLGNMMQQLAGQNSVTRGQPSDNIKSGQMAALFHAIALESGHIRAATFNEFRERMGMLLVEMMRGNAKGRFLATIVGEDEHRHLQYFEAEALQPVRRLFIQTTNPMLRARAGILEVANYLKDVPGAVRTPTQAIQAFTTGQVKPLYRSAEQEIKLVQWENEQLRKGVMSWVDPVTGQTAVDDNGLPFDGELQVVATPVPRLDPMTGMQAFDPMTGQPAFDVELSLKDVPARMQHSPWVHVNEHEADADPNESPAVTKAREIHEIHHMRVYRDMPPDLAAIRGFPPPGAAAPMPGITSPDGGMSQEAKKEPGRLSPVDETGTKLPKPAAPPPGADVIQGGP